MSYRSDKPSKQKRNLYLFMERYKKHGCVSAKKLQNYVERKGYEFHRNKHFKSYYNIHNQRGTSLGGIRLNKQKRIDHWLIN